MPRIRTIKPEFFTHETIVALSPLARLLYIALWCEADREGRLKWSLVSLRLKYLPADACEFESVAQELIDAGLVIVYEVVGKAYAVLPSFLDHQVINIREAKSRISPPPESAAPAVHMRAHAFPCIDDEKPCDVSGEWKGREGVGKEEKGKGPGTGKGKEEKGKELSEGENAIWEDRVSAWQKSGTWQCGAWGPPPDAIDTRVPMYLWVVPGLPGRTRR